MSKKSTIHFVLTGGTIDSYDSDIHYPLIPLEKSIILAYIKSLKLDNKTKFTTICLKDSREILKTDLKKLLNNIKKKCLPTDHYYLRHIRNARYCQIFKFKYQKE